MALHSLQLGLSEECLLSFSEKLGVSDPRSQIANLPAHLAAQPEWSALGPPLRRRVTVYPIVVLRVGCAREAFTIPRWGRGAAARNQLLSPPPPHFLSNQIFSPKRF